MKYSNDVGVKNISEYQHKMDVKSVHKCKYLWGIIWIAGVQIFLLKIIRPADYMKSEEKTLNCWILFYPILIWTTESARYKWLSC